MFYYPQNINKKRRMIYIYEGNVYTWQACPSTTHFNLFTWDRCTPNVYFSAYAVIKYMSKDSTKYMTSTHDYAKRTGAPADLVDFGSGWCIFPFTSSSDSPLSLSNINDLILFAVFSKCNHPARDVARLGRKQALASCFKISQPAKTASKLSRNWISWMYIYSLACFGSKSWLRHCIDCILQIFTVMLQYRYTIIETNSLITEEVYLTALRM